jgi:integrase/recombinase XerD
VPAKLSTTISKIATISNTTNSALVKKFCEYMKANGASERHQNNSLKMVIAFANFLGPDVTFYDIMRKDQITAFLDTEIKSLGEDPDKKWITTWNYYLIHIKLFFRWLHNHNGKAEDEILSQSEWITP